MDRSIVKDGLEVVGTSDEAIPPVALPGLPRFTGGAVGFIGYEFIHDVEPVVPRPPSDDLQTPAMYFLIADELLIFDRVAQTLTILVNAVLDDDDNPEELTKTRLAKSNDWFRCLSNRPNTSPVDVPRNVPDVPFESNVPKEIFRNVLKAKKYITAGDIIQVVGSQRFSTPVRPRRWIFIAPRVRSILRPTCFCWNWTGFSLVGASPEIHVRCEERNVEIRPIAGTRRAAKPPTKTKRSKKNCSPIPKSAPSTSCWSTSRATILGRVCDFGTVQVKDLMIIERYSHVMHIVSQVEGKLSPDKTPYDLMRATFPGRHA